MFFSDWSTYVHNIRTGVKFPRGYRGALMRFESMCDNERLFFHHEMFFTYAPIIILNYGTQKCRKIRNYEEYEDLQNSRLMNFYEVKRNRRKKKQ